MTSHMMLRNYCVGGGQVPVTKRHKEYLVLWKDYSLDDASWTPAENFTYQEELKKMIKRDKPVEDN